MSAHEPTREELLASLAWQLGCGIDEVISDYPVQDQSLRRLEEFCETRGEKTQSRPDQTQVSPLLNHAEPLVEASTPEVGSGLDTIGSLSALRSALERFEGCALKNTASNLVFCDGNPGARVMIVGEAPGRDEDRVGLPFVGVAGQLLDRMLASIGLDRSMVYITNLLPWRPPGNRTPTAEETQLLLPYLRRHIQLANPEFVFILGGASAKALLQSRDGILKLRGTWRDIDFGDGVCRPTLASLHPAYLLRSPAQKRLSFDDLLSLRSRLS